MKSKLPLESTPLKLRANQMLTKSKKVKKSKVSLNAGLSATSASLKLREDEKKLVDNSNLASSNLESSIGSGNGGDSSFTGSSAKKKKNKRKSDFGKKSLNASAREGNENFKVKSFKNGFVNGGAESFDDTKSPIKSKKKRCKKKRRNRDRCEVESAEVSKTPKTARPSNLEGFGKYNQNTESFDDTESPINSKKKQSKKKSGNSDRCEVQNAEVTKTSNTARTTDFEGIGEDNQNMKKRRKDQLKEPTDSAQSSLAPKQSSVLEDEHFTSNNKQKREKFKNSKKSSLREKMLSRLSAARFRFINEELYTWDGQESPKVFASNPQSFKAYHSGFKQQTKLWPVNPIDLIIKSIKNVPDFEKKVIADFGCGEAKLALELSSNKVYSFDLVAINDRVTICDNANTKLYSGSVDIAVHCLSLMSSNISGYIKEANRVLKIGGVLKIAEVESRFEDIDEFAENVSKFNFKLLKKDLTRNLFYFLDFEKVADIGVARKRKLPVLSLQPCLYKKR